MYLHFNFCKIYIFFIFFFIYTFFVQISFILKNSLVVNAKRSEEENFRPWHREPSQALGLLLYLGPYMCLGSERRCYQLHLACPVNVGLAGDLLIVYVLGPYIFKKQCNIVGIEPLRFLIGDYKDNIKIIPGPL